MIPIQLDFSDLREEFSMSQGDVNKLLDFTVKEVAAKFATLWEKEAAKELSSSRNLYMRSIVVTNPGPGMGAVELVNDIPNMIESGAAPWDMKPDLLNGPKAKVGENGKRFNTIPYSIGTPNALPENFSTIMPNDIYQTIKEKPQDIKIPGGVRSKGLGAVDIPEKYMPKPKKVFDPASKTFQEYTIKSSIYEGIIRQKSDKTGQNSYTSFRRVSENSDPLSWLHPGFKARNFAEAAITKLDLPREVSKAIDKHLIKEGYATE